MGVRGGLAAWYAGAAYAASAAVCCLLAVRSQANLVDLHVYRMGGAAVLHGGDLYRLRFAWLSFTYPPFAAVVFTALAAVPWGAAAALLTCASAVALPAALYLALRLPRNVPGAHWLGLSAKALVHSVACVLVGLLVLALAAGYRSLPARVRASQTDQEWRSAGHRAALKLDKTHRTGVTDDFRSDHG